MPAQHTLARAQPWLSKQHCTMLDMHVLKEWWGFSPSEDDLTQFGLIQLYLGLLRTIVLSGPVKTVCASARRSGSAREARTPITPHIAALPLPALLHSSSLPAPLCTPNATQPLFCGCLTSRVSYLVRVSACACHAGCRRMPRSWLRCRCALCTASLA